MEIRTKPRVFTYTVGVAWDGEKRGTMSAAGKPRLEVASPPEFKGHPGVWSPEDMFVAAVNACTMLTFLAFAGRKGIELASYECDATGSLEMVDGAFRFSTVRLNPRIVVANPDDRDRAIETFREAEASCLVARSLLTVVEGEPQVTAASV